MEEAGALGRSIHSSSLEEPELEDAPDALDPITSQPKSKKQQRAKNALDMWENLAKSASTPSTIGVGIKRSAEGQPADAIAKQIKKI